MPSAPRSLFVAGFDSGLKLADRFAEAFEQAGAEVTLAAPTTGTRHQLSPGQVRAITSRPVRYLPQEEILRLARDSDTVVPIYDGSRVEQFIAAVHETPGQGRLPVIGTAYVGMVLYNNLHGYIWRALGDVIAVNSAEDLRDFLETARALGLPEDNLLLTGLPLLPAHPAPARGGAVRRVLFADQPTVPALAEERAYLYDRLADYARRHPDREMIVRPRHRPDEATFHEMTYSPAVHFARVAPPPNLRIDYTPIAERLPSTDLVLSVSSTAILEALAAGCRVAFLADFFGEPFLNSRFVRSGLLRTFDALDTDDIGTPDPEWLRDVFPSAATSPAATFAARMLELVEADDRPHDRAWAHPFHQNRRRIAGAVRERADALAGSPLRRAVRAALPEPVRRRLLTAARRIRR
ncbi:DUF6716 putative glycosyltransferase [Lysobacter korlensis]|uniref:DUF6716 putative glycosyltransferase n=1 Tax=Lysobacter korlensis TaxID=553636 RepID=A0ABV6S005_9GAMM